MKRFKNSSSQDENWVMAICIVIAMAVGMIVMIICGSYESQIMGVLEAVCAGFITGVMTFAVLMALVSAIIQCVEACNKKKK